MLKSISISAAVVAVAASLVWAQQPPAKKAPASPPAETSVTIAGKALSMKYSAPSVRGRQIFGEGGQVSKDPNYPVWRAGANSATAFHTEADLNIKGLDVPKGDYTIFALVNVTPWQLIINKQTGQWGTQYSEAQDLARVDLNVGATAAPVEQFTITLTGTGAAAGLLTMEWENTKLTIPFAVK